MASTWRGDLVSFKASRKHLFLTPSLTFITLSYILLPSMPVSIDHFKKAPEKALRIEEGTNAKKTLNFLLKNPDKAFTRKEIMEATGIKNGSIGVTLSRLREKGLVRHKGNYWALAEDDEIATLASEIYGTKTANEKLGEESEEVWLDRE